MIKGGTVDLTNRPVVHHADGSVSTLWSGSFPYREITGNRKDTGEVLVPFVTQDGKMMVDKNGKPDPIQARDYAKKTGQILGVFNNWKDADAYANLLHSKQGAYQTWKNGGSFKPSAEVYDQWKDTE